MSEAVTPLKPLDAPRSLAEDAADRIREQILAGGFGPGEHLVEAKIAEQLNISRGPVREAFKLLRAEGLLKEEPRRGTLVGAPARGPQGGVKGDPIAVSRADLAFHEGLCALCGNARIHEVFMRYVPTLRALLRLDEQVLRSLDEVSNQHRPLVDAIRSGSEDEAGTLLAEHAEHAGDLIAELMAAQTVNG
jgi:GntR family transcriptional regulator of gluconate operon